MTVPGVADVLNMGGSLRQYRITMDPQSLAAYGLSLAEFAEAVKSGNENASGGFVSTGPTEYNMRAIGRFDSVEDIRDTVIGVKGGVPMTVGNVAEAAEGTALRRGIATRNGQGTVVAVVIKQQNADTVQVVQGIEHALKELGPTLPPGVKIVPYYDQTHLIDHALRSVTRATLVGAVLVVLVLLAFLGQLRSTLVVAVSLPLSVIIAGGLMRLCGVGLNTMSLGGLAIAVGIMVDASIIMVENIHHRLHARASEPRLRVAYEAAREMGRPVAFATLIIIAVFLPLFLMGGVEGLMFRPLAVTVAAAMLVSLLLSLTLVPVLAARLLQPNGDGPEGEVRFLRLIKRRYRVVLEYALTHRRGTALVALALLVPAGFGLLNVGRDFMPHLEEGAWVVSTVTPPETSLEEGNRISEQVDVILRANPNVQETVRRNGRSERAVGCVLPVNSGEIIVTLKPRSQLSRPLPRASSPRPARRSSVHLAPVSPSRSLCR